MDSQWDAAMCRKAMDSLVQLLDINVELYRATKRRAAQGETAEGETELLEEYGQTFSQLQSRLEQVCSPPPSMAAPLEKYSELLLQLVQSKLNACS